MLISRLPRQRAMPATRCPFALLPTHAMPPASRRCCRAMPRQPPRLPRRLLAFTRYRVRRQPPRFAAAPAPYAQTRSGQFMPERCYEIWKHAQAARWFSALRAQAEFALRRCAALRFRSVFHTRRDGAMLFRLCACAPTAFAPPAISPPAPSPIDPFIDVSLELRCCQCEAAARVCGAGRYAAREAAASPSMPSCSFDMQPATSSSCGEAQRQRRSRKHGGRWRRVREQARQSLAHHHSPRLFHTRHVSARCSSFICCLLPLR